MSDTSARGIGRFFRPVDENGVDISVGVPSAREGEYAQTIAALRSRVAELESAVGRPSFIDLDDDTLTQIAAEDAAVHPVIVHHQHATAAELVGDAAAGDTGREWVGRSIDGLAGAGVAHGLRGRWAGGSGSSRAMGEGHGPHLSAKSPGT